MRSGDDVLGDLRAARDDACRLSAEINQNQLRLARLMREAREHPELSVERAAAEINMPRRTAYEYAKEADEFDPQ